MADPVSREVPFRPEDNCVFVIHEKSLAAWKDVLSDGNGAWKVAHGPRLSYFVYVHGELESTTKEEYDADEDGHCFSRQLWTCESSKDFKRVYIRATDERCSFSLLSYYFTDKVHVFEPAAHGNRKNGSVPYSQTFESVTKSLKEGDRKCGLKAYKNSRDAIYSVKNPAALPSSKEQIRNLTRHSQPVDDIVGLEEKCKREYDYPDVRFIREICPVPSLFICLASQRQLNDMVRFCTDERNFSVMGIDTLFNVGNFNVTAVTYRHLLLRSKSANIGTHPVMLGK